MSEQSLGICNESKTICADMGQRCGKLYLNMDYNEKGKLCRIAVHGSKMKSGACDYTFWGTIMDMVNHKLEHGSIPRTLANFMVGRVCPEDRSHLQDGYCSCIDAVGKALLQEK